MAVFEFHVSRRARDAHGFEDALFASDGNVIFADFVAARIFALKINTKRPPEQAVRAGHINALGLIDELQHAVLRSYREQKKPGVIGEALDWLTARLGPDAVASTLGRFVEEFPPVAVYQGKLSAEEYLAGETRGVAHRHIALEEMLMVWLANLNPAFGPFRELFDDGPLRKETAYPEIMAGLGGFFAEQPRFGPDDQNLIDLLRAPALAAPASLAAQLEFIRARWGPILGPLVTRLWRGLDFIQEEEKAAFSGAGPALTPLFGPEAQAASQALFGRLFGGAERRGPDPEPERYSPDLDWMPNLVLIAKNTYVWLDQLSREYRRSIARLDQIPDEELDRLRRRGITGLWLIGLWERSPASRRIKQMMGNPEAVSSAYSLFDYRIAEDLGGDAALQDIKVRARRRGIRLASDMVPNHMGIDSRWVIEHPDWFIGLDRPPFPAYAYDGPDLSWDERVGIQIENRYYDRADAAVVFKRFDKWTGSVRYIYHGNDGTSYPWNDTAQLDFLNAEVREAVIQTILRVARDFPVIRFDAAMTLAKRHYQRLWFPEPGTGGAIPSRAEHGLTRDEFDAAMPVEFWRDVVDRVAKEAPDTLLLAEAFWLMEGYFVRTLGMHRVYNSAFMNMLRDEDNAKYRSVVKATLEFDPEVLKRYVNFMNNPDERTAIDQFGDGDKYFGVCTMLATLPGLPMIGHGQVEGLTEKYGMEYRRAYYDELPKAWLVERHEREIVPLLHKRHLFSGVDQFLLYDLFRADGRVDENVFAYSNGRGDERALVVYHNKYADTRGWIRTSAAFAVKTGHGEEKTMVRKDLMEGLRLRDEPDLWLVFKDQASGLEFIRNCRDLCREGLFVELGAYKYHVFTEFREIRDDASRRYARLADDLKGAGTASIDEASLDVFLRPILVPFKELLNAGFFEWLLENRVFDPSAALSGAPGDEVVEKAVRVLRGIRDVGGAADSELSFDPAEMRRGFEAVLQLPVVARRFPRPASGKYRNAVRYVLSGLGVPEEAKTAERRKGPPKPAAVPPPPEIEERLAWGSLFAWAAVRTLSGERIGGWRLDRVIAAELAEMGLDAGRAEQAARAIKASAALWHRLEADFEPGKRPLRLAQALFGDDEMRGVLGVNAYQGADYFNKESFERMLWWLMAVAIVDITSDLAIPAGEVPEAVVGAFDVIKALAAAEARSDYRVDRLLAVLRE